MVLSRSFRTHKNKTQIAFLDQGETLGGSERFLLDFFRSLGKSDFHRFSFSVFGGYHPQYQKMCPSEIQKRILVYPSVQGKGFKRIKNVWNLFKTAKKIQKKFQQEDIEQVFSNTPRTHFVMLLAKMFFREKRPWHVMIHDFTIPAPILRKIALYADTLIVNSTPTRNYVRETIASKHFSKMRIVENTVDTKIIPPCPPPASIEKILLIGRLDPRKGQKYALEAADLLLERNPELRFWIVGSPFEQDPRTIKYAQELKTFAQERDLKNVEFYPEVNSPFETLHKSDLVLVLPTEPETFGRVVIEALSMNKLVLSFDETGPREILKNYEHFLGYSTQDLLVESQNTMDLAEKIAFFADHPELIRKYTEKAREFIESSFSPFETKKRLLEIFVKK